MISLLNALKSCSGMIVAIYRGGYGIGSMGMGMGMGMGITYLSIHHPSSIIHHPIMPNLAYHMNVPVVLNYDPS